MRKKVLVTIVLALMLGMFASLWSQTTITLGTQVVQSGTSGIGPTNYYWEARRIQWVYTAAEIIAAGGSAGSISSIAYDVSQIAGGNLLNYRVKMAHTTATDASSHNTATLTTVKNAHTFAPGATGWRTITFDTNFEWNGTSNILFDVSWGVNAGYSSSGQVWLYNNVSNQMRGVTSGSASVENSNTTTARSGKPRAQLTITSSGGVSNPTSVTAVAVNYDQINLAWTKNDNSDNVMIAVNSTSTFGTPVGGVVYGVDDVLPGGGTVIYNGGDTSFEHTHLDENTTYYYKLFSVDSHDEYSGGAPVDARTPMAPLTSFPWTETF